MTKGLGTDIVEVARIASMIERHGEKVLKRLFTDAERLYCQTFKDQANLHYAGRFAAKEAVVKALGTGFSDTLWWHDIEVVRDEKGKPSIRLSERANLQFSNPRLLLSISHCKQYATAVAMWEE